MTKPKHFVLIIAVAALITLLFGNWIAPVQADNTYSGTPIPTNTPFVAITDSTEDNVSAEQQEEIKSVIQAYFEIRYHALSVSDDGKFQHQGFGSLIAEEHDALVFLNAEMGKLIAEIKRAELHRLRYVDYKYSLDFHSFLMDTATQIATVSLVEENSVIYEISAESNSQNPVVSRMYNREHTITLRKQDNQWKIVSDNYDDYLWRIIRQRKFSPEDILDTIKTSPKTPIKKAETLATNLLSDGPNHPYDRAGAVEYAIEHAGSPNPDYYDYKNEGGDCTNFISQAIYERGNASMSIPTILPPPSDGGNTHWYYLNKGQRAAAWTEVNSFYQFVTTQGWGEGPVGSLLLELDNYEIPETMPAGLMLGDVIQFEWGPDRDGNGDLLWDHAVIVVGFASDGTPYVASRTEDYASVPYMEFSPWQKIRFIHIERSDGYPPVKAEITQGSDDAGSFHATCAFSSNANEVYFGVWQRLHAATCHRHGL